MRAVESPCGAASLSCASEASTGGFPDGAVSGEGCEGVWSALATVAVDSPFGSADAETLCESLSGSPAGS